MWDWVLTAAPVAAAIFAGLTLLILWRARRPNVRLHRGAASRGRESIRFDITAQNCGEVPCRIRQIEIFLDGEPAATGLLSIEGADQLTFPIAIPVGRSVRVGIGLRPPDIDVASNAPPLLGRHVTVRAWLTRRRKVDLAIIGAPLGTKAITRVLNAGGTVAHDCGDAGCSTSWDGRDLLTGERVPGAGPLPPLVWIDEHTVRLGSTHAVPAAE